ncbi:MAG: TolC family protein [Acidobacteriaceae bacterium]
MKILPLQTIPGALLATLILVSAAIAQTDNATAVLAPISPPAANTVYGSVTSQRPVAAVLPLSLDDAVRRGLQFNLQTTLAKQNQRLASGDRLEAINFLLPTITWQASRSRNQINLAAEGFSSKLIKSFPPGLIPPGAANNIPTVVTVNEVQAQANFKQTLFDLHSLELYRAAEEGIRTIDYSYQSARGNVIQVVADSYLQALAAAANLTNAQGLLSTNKEFLRQATLKHQAGVTARLDELRARVQYQQQEQVVIAQQNALEKTQIALKRQIGLPADQAIRLTNKTPYADLQVIPLDQALPIAYANRQEYLLLQAQLRATQYQSRAARFERLPTLSFNGNYGVTGTVGGVYHGTFLTQGTLTIPLFHEARLRGDRDVADAATDNAMAQLASYRHEIEAQIRDSMLDVTTAKQLVAVARSNVALSRASLGDARDRFRNGIDDNLPVVEAQSTLASAEAQLVNSQYQYNVAKLALARSLGVIDKEFHIYLDGSQHAMDSSARAAVR